MINKHLTIWKCLVQMQEKRSRQEIHLSNILSIRETQLCYQVDLRGLTLYLTKSHNTKLSTTLSHALDQIIQTQEPVHQTTISSTCWENRE